MEGQAEQHDQGNSGKRYAADGGRENSPPSKRARDSVRPVELRLLLISSDCGGIIGKGGENIKHLRKDYEATVEIPDTAGPERICHINTSFENILQILKEVIVVLEAKLKSPEEEVEIRFLCHQSQAGSIIGRGGGRIKELRKDTSTEIKVHAECCPHSTDRVILVRGGKDGIIDAVEKIYDCLLSATPRGQIMPYDPQNFDEGFAAEYGGFTFDDNRGGRALAARRGAMGGRRGGMGGRGGMAGGGAGGSGMMGYGGNNQFGMGGMAGGAAAAGAYGGAAGGMAAFGAAGMPGMAGMAAPGMAGAGGAGMGGYGAGGGAGGPTTTTQVSIPDEMAGAIIGKGGSKINAIRRDSQAVINIDQSETDPKERIISITGTQEQIQNAQLLLQQCVKNARRY